MRSMALRKWRRNALILSFSDGPPGLCAVFCLAEPFFVPARCVFCSCELPLWSFFFCDFYLLSLWLPGLACSHFSVPFAHERPLCVLTRAPAGGRHPPTPRRTRCSITVTRCCRRCAIAACWFTGCCRNWACFTNRVSVPNRWCMT